MNYLLFILQQSEGLKHFTENTEGVISPTKIQLDINAAVDNLSTSQVMYVGLTDLFLQGKANR